MSNNLEAVHRECLEFKGNHDTKFQVFSPHNITAIAILKFSFYTSSYRLLYRHKMYQR